MPPDLLRDFLSAERNKFPNGHNYVARYEALASYLSENVHTEVVLGAIAKDGGMLNDHGPKHIETVISRASSLLSGAKAQRLTPYESYLLLCAIQFHDVGNIFGRENHEKRHVDVIKGMRSSLGDDSTEIRVISKIAYSHGGKIDGSEDKISLLEDDPVNGKDVRVKALAAILKFADELAEDKYRASRYLLSKDLIPDSSQVFHKYSESLDSVMIRPDESSIDLNFFLSASDARRTWGKINKKSGTVDNVFLLDEIHERTFKTHLERVYCSRFIRQFVNIDRINVKIEIFEEPDSFHPPLRRIFYRLEERGYPFAGERGIHSICDDLETGEKLAETLKELA